MFKILQTQIPIHLFWHNHLTDNSPSLSHNINIIIIIIIFIVVDEKDGIPDDFQNLNFYMDCLLKTLRKKKKKELIVYN